MPIAFPATFWSSSSGGSSAPTPLVYWEADYGIVTTTNGTTADASPVSGNKVLSWTSKDSSATAASYGTNANRPTYYTSPVGAPYLTFDGGQDQKLQTTAWNSTTYGASQYTMGVVFRKPAAYAGYRNQNFFSLGTLSASLFSQSTSWGFFAGGFAGYGGTNVLIQVSSAVTGSSSVFGTYSTASTSPTVAAAAQTKYYQNGALIASNTTSTGSANTFVDQMQIGGSDVSYPYKADFFGVYYYNSQLSDAQVAAAHSAAMTRMGVTDPYAVFNSLLLHMDGANGSTTFTDSSPNALTVTPYGSAAISTSNAMAGFGQVGQFDGTTAYLLVANSSKFDFGTGDFTVELWARFTTSTPGVNYALIGKGTSVFNSNAGWFFTRHSTNKLRFVFTDDGSSSFRICDSTSSFLPTVNTWYHLAAVRSLGIVTLYINGVASGSASLPQSVYASTRNLGVAGDSVGGILFPGQLDEIRITNGVARYTANFTVPSGPFPNS